MQEISGNYNPVFVPKFRANYWSEGGSYNIDMLRNNNTSYETSVNDLWAQIQQRLEPYLQVILKSFCFCNENSVKDGLLEKHLWGFTPEKHTLKSTSKSAFKSKSETQNLMSTQGRFSSKNLKASLNCSKECENEGSPQNFSSKTTAESQVTDGNSCKSSENSKKDMINYEVLKGHPYEIKENTEKKEKGARQYICRYSDWNKVFYKTWNLVYHFRVHTNSKPFQCKSCGKGFTQKANLLRHLPVHEDIPLHKRKIFDCPKCSRKYSNKYNLNVSYKYEKHWHYDIGAC